jgi:uncharacterized membrane protein YhdT
MTNKASTKLRMIETLPAVFIIGLSLALLAGTSGLPYWAGVTPGSRFLPVWLAGAGLLLGILLIVSLIRRTDLGELDLPEASSAMRVILTIAAMGVFALAVPLVGMVPMLVLFMAFMLLVVLRQRVLPSLITVFVVVGFIYTIFVRWLQVPLPAPFGF